MTDHRPPSPATSAAYYSVIVTTNAQRHRGTSLCWSRQYARLSDAYQAGKVEVVEGRATLAFVVRIEAGRKIVCDGGTYPPSARRIIAHYEELWASIEDDQ